MSLLIITSIMEPLIWTRYYTKNFYINYVIYAIGILIVIFKVEGAEAQRGYITYLKSHS